MVAANHHQDKQYNTCGCLVVPHQFLVNDRELGLDDHFAEISLLVCSACGQKWLKYFYEVEAFTASGRWYLGAITAQQASLLKTANARSTLEQLGWYFYGGSYYRGYSGRTSGKILLNP